MSDRHFTPVSPAQSLTSAKDELAERKHSPPPQSGSVLQHRHTFMIAASETIVVRCCQTCGITHYMEKPPSEQEWDDFWQVVHEMEEPIEEGK